MNLPCWMKGKPLIFFYPITQKNKTNWHTINFFLSCDRSLDGTNMHAVFSLAMDVCVCLCAYITAKVFTSAPALNAYTVWFIWKTDALGNSTNHPQIIWAVRLGHEFLKMLNDDKANYLWETLWSSHFNILALNWKWVFFFFKCHFLFVQD